MKAIINGTEIELEKQEGNWVPTGISDVQIEKIGADKLFLIIDGQTVQSTLLGINRDEKTVDILMKGRRYSVQIKEPLDDLLHSMGLDQSVGKTAGNIKAPMPGLVLDVAVSQGATVAKGDKVLVLEAMKMENVIKSPGDGTVARILVNKGDTVDKNQVLVEFA